MSRRRRYTITALLALVTLATVTAAVIRIRTVWPGFDRLFAKAATIVEPGPLSPMHFGVPELQECRSCHSTTSDIPDSKCLHCHQEIGERLEARTGFHGTALTGSCAKCHRDHEAALIVFDRKQFNHSLATFPLVEKHATLECEACHRRTVAVNGTTPSSNRFDFIGLAHSRCEDCHRDPHAGTLTRADSDCQRCHDQTAFGERHLRFEHGRDSSFPLRGAHADLKCAQCHVPPRDGAPLAEAQFVGLGTSCADCHEDPHRGTLTNVDRTCTDCHDETAWTGRHLAFDHARVAAFPLRGQHADVACSECHRPATPGAALATADFSATSTSCADCHADPHGGQFTGTDCSSCHRETGFRVPDLTFQHSSVARFPLTGAHAEIACADCHRPVANPDGTNGAMYRTLATSCESCHADPHAVAQDLSTARPENPAAARDLERDAVDSDCSRCHDTATFRGAQMKFDHTKMSRFELDATHRDVTCSACHSSLIFRATPTACAECHRVEADALAGRIRLGAEVVRTPGSPHESLVTCTQCHDTATGQESLERIAERCASCHTPHYTGLLLAQNANFSQRIANARRTLAEETLAPELRAQRNSALDALLHFSSHDFVGAETLLRQRFETRR